MNRIIYAFIALAMMACSKEEVESYVDITPTLTFTDIERYSAVANFTFPKEGDVEIDECGVYWSRTNPEPTDMDNRVIAKLKDGKYQAEITKYNSFGQDKYIINGGTTYYVRAYARNSVIFKTGKTVQFTTAKGLPEFQGVAAGLSNSFGVSFSVHFVDSGGGEILEQGYCRTEDKNIIPTIENSTNFILSNITSFWAETEPGHRYYMRIFMITTEGIGYSDKFTYVGSIR